MTLPLHATIAIEKVWQVSTQEAIDATPLLNKKHIYLSSYDGDLYRVDKKEGKVLWSFETENLISSTAIINQGTLFIGSGDGKIYAIYSKTGKEKWHYSTKDMITRRAVMVGNQLIFASSDGYLYALNKHDGKQLWRHKLKSTISADLLYVDDTLYFATIDHKIHAFDVENQKSLWSYTLSERVSTQPLYNSGTLYLADEKGEVVALNSQDGSKKWSFNTPTGIVVPLKLKGNRLYIATLGYALYVVDRATGKVENSYISNDAISALEVNKQHITLGTAEGYLVFIDKECHYLNAIKVDTEITSLKIDDDKLYVTDTQGTLYQFKVKSIASSMPLEKIPTIKKVPTIKKIPYIELQSQTLEGALKASSLNYTKKEDAYILNPKTTPLLLKPIVCKKEQCHVLQLTASIELLKLSKERHASFVNQHNRVHPFVRLTLTKENTLTITSELSLDEPFTHHDIEEMVQNFQVAYRAITVNLYKEQL